MRSRILRMIFAEVLAGLSLAGAQTPPSSARPTLDEPSNGVLELSARPILDTAHGRDPAPTIWQGLVEVTVKNISQRPVRIAEGALTYELSAWDSSGMLVPKTRFGEQVEAAQRDGPTRMPATATVDLLPGQEYTRTLGLRTYFLIEPGRDCTVRLKRWDRSMALIDESGKRLALRELSKTLKAVGHPASR